MKASRTSNQVVAAKLDALNLPSLTEEERLSAVAEIRAQLAEVAEKKAADPVSLGRKLALLKLWQKLVQMRVIDLQNDLAPPEVKPVVERMFAPEPEEKPEELPKEAAVEQPIPEPPPTKKRKVKSTVSVELTEEAVIKGKTFSAGEVVQVSRKEADGLVEAGKGTVSG